MKEKYNLLARDPKDVLLTILSSADSFPGFYRYNLGPRVVRPKQLRLEDISDILLADKAYVRETWLGETKEVYEVLEFRDKMHSELGMIKYMRERYYDWLLLAKKYRLLCLDIYPKEESIKDNTSYFFMGSLIKILENEVHIGEDHITETPLHIFPCDGDEILDWLNKIYSKKINELFLPANEIGELRFDESDKSKLYVKEDRYHESLLFESPVIFGSNYDRNKDLAIRYAKDIIIGNPL